MIRTRGCGRCIWRASPMLTGSFNLRQESAQSSFVTLIPLKWDIHPCYSQVVYVALIAITSLVASRVRGRERLKFFPL